MHWARFRGVVNLRVSELLQLLRKSSAESMELASAVKLNHEGTPRIMRLFELEHRSEERILRAAAVSQQSESGLHHSRYNGSLLISADEYNEHPGYKVQVADTVGAGDAFTAALVQRIPRREPLAQINDISHTASAPGWPASQAQPRPEAGGLKRKPWTKLADALGIRALLL